PVLAVDRVDARRGAPRVASEVREADVARLGWLGRRLWAGLGAIRLVRRGYDVVVSVLVEVGDRRPVDRLGDDLRLAARRMGVREPDGVVGDGLAVRAKGVEVAVERGLDDVARAVRPLKVAGDGRAGDEAALRVPVLLP